MLNRDPYDNYLLSYRESGQKEWTPQNIAPMTLDQALAWESILECKGREFKIQYNGTQFQEETNDVK